MIVRVAKQDRLNASSAIVIYKPVARKFVIDVFFLTIMRKWKRCVRQTLLARRKYHKNVISARVLPLGMEDRVVSDATT